MALLGAGVDTRVLAGLAAVPADRDGAATHGAGFLIEDATAVLFLQHLDTPFAIRSAQGTRARLVLREVIERSVSKNVEQFSLIFHAPSGLSVRDGTYAIEHSALGDFNLFLVSVGASNRRHTVYQACFARHVRSREARTVHTAQSIPRDWRM
jgi:hypothetical protein